MCGWVGWKGADERATATSATDWVTSHQKASDETRLREFVLRTYAHPPCGATAAALRRCGRSRAVPACNPRDAKPPPGGRTPGGGFAYWRRANVAFRLGGRRGHSRRCNHTPNHWALLHGRVTGRPPGGATLCLRPDPRRSTPRCRPDACAKAAPVTSATGCCAVMVSFLSYWSVDHNITLVRP